jgi:hypothetical protein
MPAAGTLRVFTGHVEVTSVDVTFRVFVNGAASAVSCTIKAGETTCGTESTATLAAGDGLSVEITHPTGAVVRNADWVAVYS